MRQSSSLLLTCIALVSTTFLIREWDYRQTLQSVKPPLTVYVSGAVRNPGVVTLQAEARRIQAVELCGGLSEQADTSQFEPAKHLVDGETIVVPELPAAPAAQMPSAGAEPTTRTQSSSYPQSGDISPNIEETPAAPVLVNLNSATAAELETLPGIGPVTAQRIVEARNSLPGGTFQSLEDLTAIRGIKGKTLARLRPYLEPEGL